MLSSFVLFLVRRCIYNPVILPGEDNLHGYIDEHAYSHVDIIGTIILEENAIRKCVI